MGSVISRKCRALQGLMLQPRNEWTPVDVLKYIVAAFWICGYGCRYTGFAKIIVNFGILYITMANDRSLRDKKLDQFSWSIFWDGQNSRPKSRNAHRLPFFFDHLDLVTLSNFIWMSDWRTVFENGFHQSHINSIFCGRVYFHQTLHHTI